MTWYGLRQQTEKHVIDGVIRPSRCLADFVAPKSSGIADYAGMFAVTAGLGIEKKEKAFIDALDDYSAIMFKSLADRLAEAFAECLHHRVRTDLWGYAAGEQLSNEDMIAEKYQGIRPAPGYPACPDHSAKTALFQQLQCEEIGMSLTESLAMTPAASVSGFYIGHPDAVYFNVGKIGEDQLHDMAGRRGTDEAVLARVHEPLSVFDALEVGRTMHSWSLDASLSRVATEGKGVVVFLNCGESPDQLLAQFDGTAKASHGPERGRMDLRTYGVGAQILRECGVHKMTLMGNPRRMPSMTGYGLEIVGYVTA
jgi:GTP cyclohydrolase II